MSQHSSADLDIPRNIPFQSIGQLFKGRRKDIEQLHDLLNAATQATSTGAASTIVAINGLGGIGKTRLAIEYAWEHVADFEALLFIRGETQEQIQTTFAALTHELTLNLSEREFPDLATQRNAVIKWLRAHPRYLLIIDNIDDFEALKAARALINELPAGQIICTGRIGTWPSNIKQISLAVLSEDASADFLLSVALHRLACPEDDSLAREIAKKVGGLVLALEQAAAYVNTQHISFADYLADWGTRHEKVLEWFDDSQTDYPCSVATTWELSFRKLSPAATRLLELLAWFTPAPIPTWLLAHAATQTMNEERQPSIDRDGVVELAKYGLATWNTAKPFFSIHRLVQDVTRYRLTKEARNNALAIDVLIWVTDAFQKSGKESDAWEKRDALAPHAEILATATGSPELKRLTGALNTELARWFDFHGYYKEGINHARKGFEQLKDALGEDHLDTFRSRNVLASLLRENGELSQAEAEHRACFVALQEKFGPEHLHTLASRNSLANVLQESGRYGEAEEHHNFAFEAYKRIHGPDHVNTLKARDSRATALSGLGQHEKAVLEHQYVLKIFTRDLGPDNLDTLTARSNLANALQRHGKPKEAELENRIVLMSREKQLHADHPEVLSACLNLAMSLSKSTDKTEAMQLARRALDGFSRKFGESNRNTRNARKMVEILARTA